jgi:hypothetical protein
VNQGNASVALGNGVLSLSAIGTGSDQVRLYGSALPPTPWTVIAAFIPGSGQTAAGTGGYSEGLALSDGSKFRTWWLGYSAGNTAANLAAQGYDSTTSFDSNQNLISRFLPPWPLVWLKIQDNGTTRSFYLAVDPTNVGWTLLGSEASGNFLTPTVAGIAMDIFGSALNGSPIVGMPWLSFQILPQ